MIGQISFKTCAFATPGEEANGMLSVTDAKAVVLTRAGKTQRFEFEQVGYAEDKDDLGALFFKTVVPMVELCLLGFNSSLFLLSRDKQGKDARIKERFCLESEFGVYPTLLGHLFAELRGSGQPFSVTAKGFEVFSERIRDIASEITLSPSSSSSPSRIEPTRRGLKLQSDKLLGVCVQGLVSWRLDSVSAAMALVHALYSKRMTLFTTEGSSVASAASVGSVSHLFIRLEIEVGEIRSVCQVTDLAGSETLSFQPTEGNNIFFVARDRIANLSDSSQENLLGGKIADSQDVWLNTLTTGQRSLTALSRIVRMLRETKARGEQQQQHVPYRESHLTRVLQPVLSGNFAGFALCLPGTLVPGDDSGKSAQSAANLLRFASELQALENYIFTNRSKTVPSAALQSPRMDSINPTGVGGHNEGTFDKGPHLLDKEWRPDVPTVALNSGIAMQTIKDDLSDLLKQLREALASATTFLKDMHPRERVMHVFSQAGCRVITQEEARTAGVEFFAFDGNQDVSATIKGSPVDSLLDLPMAKVSVSQEDGLSSELSGTSRTHVGAIAIRSHATVKTVAATDSSDSLSSPLILPLILLRSKLHANDGTADGQSFQPLFTPREMEHEDGNEEAADDEDDGGQTDVEHTDGKASPEAEMRWGGHGPLHLWATDGMDDTDNVDSGFDTNDVLEGARPFRGDDPMQSSPKKDIRSKFFQYGLNLADNENGGNLSYVDDDEKEVALPSLWSNKPKVESNAAKSKLGKSAKAGFRGSMDSSIDEDVDCRGDLSQIERSFLRAVSQSRYKEAGDKLRQGVDVHVRNTFKRDAMQIAARNCDWKMLQMLHQRGGRVNSRGPKGDTPVHLAAYNGGVKAIQWLVEFGAVPWAVDMVGQHAGHYAARRCNHACLRFLHTDLGLNLEQEDFEGMTPYGLVPRVASDEDSVSTRSYFEENGIFK